jgi:hypothetical protein
MTPPRLLVVATSLGVLLGAEGDGCGARRVPVAVLRAPVACPGGAAPSATLVTTAEAWRAIAAADHGGPVLAGEVGEAPQGADAAPPVDLAKDVVVLVAMGEKPTGGYGIALARPEAAVKDGVAFLQVVLRVPAKDAMVTQALTRPCLAVSLPRAGVRAVTVVDAQGARVASTAAP